MAERLRLGLVGAGFMAQMHTMGLRDLRSVYGDTVPDVELVRIADIDLGLAQASATRQGWADATDDIARVTQADDVDAVSIVTPNAAHAAAAIDAARHGKHVLCEKPLAADLGTARSMAEAVVDAGVTHQVNFVYRSWPAVSTARRIIADGRLGRILHYRGHHFHDYALDRQAPLSWRFVRAQAGAGALGDLGSHAVDLARYLLDDEVVRVAAQSRTVVTDRPTSVGSAQRGPVEVDDATDLMLELASGVAATIGVSWVEAGRKCDWGFEVVGETGSLRFSWQHANELRFYDHRDPDETQGERTLIIGPAHERAGAFFSIPGPGLGYADAFTIALRDFVVAAVAGQAAAPDFTDGVRVAEVVDAAIRAADDGRWVELPRRGALLRTASRG